jgi:hypothetical protein
MQEEVDFREDYIIIGNILAKYPLATEEEQRVLEDWKRKDSNRQIFDAIIEARETDLQVILTILKDLESSREKYLARLPERTKSKVYWWNNWKMYTAAASIAIALITSAIWVSNRKSKDVASREVKPLPVVNDAAPGEYKATLTLDNGQVIVLDSAKQGTVATQGNTAVLNNGNQLEYDPSKSPAASGANLKVSFNTLTTAKGQTYVAVLSDGSKVWLNSTSSIRYPVSFTGSERVVFITGEVYFEVTHDATKPFHVKVNDMDIQVLGTQFNVNGYNDEASIKTTLLQGSVKISTDDKIKILKPGQQAQVSNSSNENDIRVISNVNTDEVISWKNGTFQFNNDGLETVMRQLARWYDLDVVYEGNIHQGQFVGTVPRNLNLSQVLEILESSDVHFKIKGKKLIVTP